MSKYKVAKSGGESISLKEIENGRLRGKSRNLRRNVLMDNSLSTLSSP